jgi:hypothetical protein
VTYTQANQTAKNDTQKEPNQPAIFNITQNQAWLYGILIGIGALLFLGKKEFILVPLFLYFVKKFHKRWHMKGLFAQKEE